MTESLKNFTQADTYLQYIYNTNSLNNKAGGPHLILANINHFVVVTQKVGLGLKVLNGHLESTSDQDQGVKFDISKMN